jgi:predicted transcriptional regulator
MGENNKYIRMNMSKNIIQYIKINRSITNEELKQLNKKKVRTIWFTVTQMELPH